MYPAFQFDEHGAPLDVVAEVLAALPQESKPLTMLYQDNDSVEAKLTAIATTCRANASAGSASQRTRRNKATPGALSATGWLSPLPSGVPAAPCTSSAMESRTRADCSPRRIARVSSSFSMRVASPASWAASAPTTLPSPSRALNGPA